MTFSTSVYRALLYLLPARLRRRHAGEMVEQFEYMVETARAGSVIAGVVTAGMACLDVFRRLPHEHARQLNARYGEGFAMTLSFRFELKQAVRSLKRQPATSMLVIAMLALGVAANTTVFSMINALFLRPLPWSESERLVYVNERAPAWNLDFTGINYPDFVAWEKDARAFDGIALYDPRSFNLMEGTTAERVQGLTATHGYFHVLRLKPVIGRTFTREEDRPNAPPVAVISHDMWQTRFGGSRDVLGRAIRIDSRPATIIGVMPPEAQFPQKTDLWLPLQGDPAQPWQNYSFDGIARMKPGVTLDEARADLDRAHMHVWEERDSARTVSPRVDLLRDHLTGEARMLSVVLGSGVAIVLLIACANVSSVLLARATGRTREIGIRRALGAGSGRIARQMFAENLVLALVGTAFGMLWGYWALRAMVGLLPEETPPWLRLDPDYRTLGFGAGIALLTALISSLAPMIQSVRSSVQHALVMSNRTSVSRAHRRTLNALVTAEIALAFILLAGGGLFLRAYERVQRVEPGFNADNVLTFRVALPYARYNDEGKTRRFYQSLTERIRAMPGVQHAAAISCPPFTCHWGSFANFEGIPPRTEEQGNPVVLTRIATYDYANAMGITIERGRFLEPADDVTDTARVVVVNRTFVNTFLPNREVIGQRMRFNDGPWFTIVGIARDVKHYGLSEPVRPGVYLPLSFTQTATSLALAIRTDGDPNNLVGTIRGALRQLDPELPMFQETTMAEALAESLAFRKMYSWLLAVFAGVALTLAVGGIYGVLSYVVGQRKREIGIRVALGAQRRAISLLVMRQGMGVALAGVAIGLLGALPISRLFKALLYGAQGQDYVTYGAVFGVLAATCLLASYIPARKALGYEPQSVLRE